MSGAIPHFNCANCKLDWTISAPNKLMCPRCGCGQDIRGFAFRNTINGFPNMIAPSYRPNVNRGMDGRNSGMKLNSTDRLR